MITASARLVASILAALECIDGNGLYHLGECHSDASDVELLRRRTARLLTRANATDRERKLEAYRLWCEGGDDRCASCTLQLATLRDAVAIGGKLFHGFFCSLRYTDLAAERIDLPTRDVTR